MNGWIKIGVKMDDKKFNAQYNELVNKINEAENTAKDLQESMYYTRDNIQLLANEIDKVNNKLLSEEQIMQRIQDLADNGIDFTYEAQTEGPVKAYQEALQFLMQGQTESLKEQNQEYNNIISKLDIYKFKIQEINNKQTQHSKIVRTTNIDLDKMGNKMSSIINKVGKWALAVVGIRSAYQMIQKAKNTIVQYDKQLATNLEYISYSLAMLLKPIIEWVINAVITLIRIINTLIYKLTGVNLLAKATPEAFQKATNSLKNANKEAKELRKQLVAFDEMNILDDNVKSTDSNLLPNIDLSKTLSDAELDKIFKKIKEKLSKVFQDVIDNINFDKLKENILNAIWGIPVINMLESQNVQKASLGILGLSSEELMQKVIEIPEMTFKILKAIFKFNEVIFNALDELFKPVLNFFKEHPIDISFNKLDFLSKKLDINQALKSLQGILNNSPLKLDKIDISKITSAFSSLPNKAKEAWSKIQSVFNGIPEWFKTKFTTAWTNVKNVFSTGGKIFDGIKEGIETSFKTIVNKLIDGINKIMTKPFDKINEMLNKIHDVNILGMKPFSSLWNKNPISIPKIPKLKTGAIINLPGRGVYRDGAYMGEAGAEGIIPLTDESAMRLLGENIGRYVTINANITNNMNGRLISRLIQEINTEQDFVANR